MEPSSRDGATSRKLIHNDDSSDEGAAPPERGGAARAALPPPAVVLTVGALPTLVVLVAMVAIGSVWAAVFGVEASWLVTPVLVCLRWPASKRLALAGWRAASQRPLLQVLVGVGLWVGSAGSAVLLFWLVGRHTGVIPGVRSRAAEYGLSETHPAAVYFFIGWFSLVNPVLEEMFWRIFLFEHMQPAVAPGAAEGASGAAVAGACECAASTLSGGAFGFHSGGGVSESTPFARGGRAAGGWPSGWGWRSASIATSALFAAYHFSVLLVFLPVQWAVLGEIFVFGYGLFLQLLTRRLGVLAAILAHGGGDAVIAFVLADCIWDFMPLLRRL